MRKIEITTKKAPYVFDVAPMTAYASLETLGKLGVLLAPVISGLDMNEIAKFKDSDSGVTDMKFMEFIKEVDSELLTEVVSALVANARYDGVPVTMRDAVWKGKLIVLVKLAFEIAKEEYTDFLSELGIEV